MSGLTRCKNGHIFSARRYGSICPYCNVTVREETEKKNRAADDGSFDEDSDYLGELEVVDPVTGWLVCRKGPQMGRDYRILAEKNFIGRADDMHIQILGDNKIARRNHAIIAYDPKTRATMLLPGDSSSLAYHNTSAVYAPTKLKMYDVIELGNSEFVFIPLCGDHFVWESLQE